MNILVIKLTSLGDVLHATGHIRTIKENYPHSHLTLLTAEASSEIYAYNPHVDRLLVFQQQRVKREWLRQPRWVAAHLLALMQEVRRTPFDLAFDLQGRFKSVMFLYAANAKRKFVKGRWWGLQRFRQPELHAITEMDRVLELAGLRVVDTRMEIVTSPVEQKTINTLVEQINPERKPMILVSPYTRWKTKNWAMEKFRRLFDDFPLDAVILFTGTQERREEIDHVVAAIRYPGVINLAGSLSLLEFAELMKRVDLVVTGDSFAMHLAGAVQVPVIALFGPTDETRIGPVGDRAVVMRAETDCRRCYEREYCRQNCIDAIEPEVVLAAIRQQLSMPRAQHRECTSRW
ncbi:MAG: glycosyltransferase family 9 protein [Nitrospirae bacterium]|nr:MAG: glycosyltransferase family 9 protein [Nitrospirota bacterium]